MRRCTYTTQARIVCASWWWASKLWLQLLKRFFLDLRAKQGAVEGMSVTLRQLESLVRLSEARARMRLSETVTLVRPTLPTSSMSSTLEGYTCLSEARD